MKITETEVRYVAGLANLDLTDEEVLRLGHDLDQMLSYIDTLNEVDTSAIEPMAQVLYEADAGATWRDDVERPPLGTEAAVRNAPVSGSGYFKVPRVIER